MKQSPLLAFVSSEFAIIPGEDSETNPGDLREDARELVESAAAVERYSDGRSIRGGFRLVRLRGIVAALTLCRLRQ